VNRSLKLGGKWRGPGCPLLASVSSRLPQASSFALVATLLMVAVITGAAVAFFQSTRIERFVARNYASLARVQLAAEGGYALAASLIRFGCANDHFLVVQNTNRQIFIGNGTNQAAPATFAYLPLFSFTNLPQGYSTNQPVVTDSNPPVLPTVGETNSFPYVLPGGLVGTSPPVVWVYLTNSSGGTNARFVFWVEDLGGRLDLSVAGTNGTNARRPTGTNPAELALWSLFGGNANLPSVTDDPTVGTLVSNRAALVTPATARLLSPTTIPTNLLGELATGLVQDTNEPELIPFGFGYADRGRPKYNLQTFGTNATNGTTNLLSIITNNLNSNGGFTSRSGGMNPTRYLHALGANIRDYIDTDSVPTAYNVPGLVGNGARIRGVEPLPLITETATSVWWYDHDTSIPNQIWFEFRTVNYVELWNPSDRGITNLSLLVNFSNSFAMGFSPAGGNVGGLALDLSRNNTITASVRIFNSDGTSLVNSTNLLTNITLAPNEFRAFQIGGTNIFRYRVAVGAGVAPISPSVQGNLKGTNGGKLVLNGPPNGSTGITNILVELYLPNSNDPILYDRAQNHRVSATAGSSGRLYPCRVSVTAPATNPYYAAAYPCLRLFNPAGSLPALPGDPRIGFYLTTTNASVGYASPSMANPGSSLGYRNANRSSVPPATDYFMIPANWLDGGHANSPYAPTPITENLAGPSLGATASAAYTNEFVQKFSASTNSTWSTVLELGNIFDPAAWNVRTNEVQISSATTAAGNGSSALTNGGGSTLRIGRPEHVRFTNNGLRASQLLDLFAVHTNPAASVIMNRVAGRINLNTASPNVLRALAAGVFQTRDPALTPNGTNFVVPVAAVTNFVAAVTNFRATRPFYSPAQLTLLTNGSAAYPSNAVFGNRIPLGVTAWNDQAAEEWFARIYPLATVRSRNFLIHVVAQAMTTNTNFPSRPVATSRQVFQVYAEPIRGTNGLTTNVNVRKLATWTL